MITNFKIDVLVQIVELGMWSHTSQTRCITAAVIKGRAKGCGIPNGARADKRG